MRIIPLYILQSEKPAEIINLKKTRSYLSMNFKGPDDAIPCCRRKIRTGGRVLGYRDITAYENNPIIYLAIHNTSWNLNLKKKQQDY